MTIFSAVAVVNATRLKLPSQSSLWYFVESVSQSQSACCTSFNNEHSVRQPAVYTSSNKLASLPLVHRLISQPPTQTFFWLLMQPPPPPPAFLSNRNQNRYEGARDVDALRTSAGVLPVSRSLSESISQQSVAKSVRQSDVQSHSHLWVGQSIVL